MEFLQRLFFESPLRLGLLSFLLLAVVLLTRQRLTGQAARYSLPVTLGVIVLLFMVQSFVTTQREQILQALDVLVTAVEQKDPVALRRVVSPQYDCAGMDRDAVVAEIKAFWEVFSIRDTRTTRREVTFEGDLAALSLRARATVSVRGGPGGFHFGQWKIMWRRASGGWKISSIHPEMLDGRRITDVRGWRGTVD